MLDRLTKVEEPQAAPNPAGPAGGGQATIERETYTLDAEGNRVASQRSAFVALKARLRRRSSR